MDDYALETYYQSGLQINTNDRNKVYYRTPIITMRLRLSPHLPNDRERQRFSLRNKHFKDVAMPTEK